MGKVFKLRRPIANAAGTGTIDEVTMKDEKDINAMDFYDVSFSVGGSTLGAMADTVANLFSLTSTQVATLHPKDFILFSGECSSFLE